MSLLRERLVMPVGCVVLVALLGMLNGCSREQDEPETGGAPALVQRPAATAPEVAEEGGTEASPATVEEPEPTATEPEEAAEPEATATPEEEPEAKKPTEAKKPVEPAAEKAPAKPKPVKKQPGDAHGDEHASAEAVKVPPMKPAGTSVIGTIEAVSEVPDPSSVPYTECLTFIKYRVESVESGDYEGDQLIAAHWGMRDSKLQPAARFTVGQRHKLTIEPLADHGDLSRVMRADDADDYSLTPYWVTKCEGR